MNEILSLDSETILSGPGRDFGDVIIDPVMGSSFENAMVDLCYEMGIRRTPAGQRPETGSEIYTFTNDVLREQKALARLSGRAGGMIVPAIDKQGCNFGVVALAERDDAPGRYKIAGFFAGSTLCVDENMRQDGLGEALVMTRLLQDEELPTWHHDEPGYSPAGAAVIEKSLQSLQAIARALLEGHDLPDRAAQLCLNFDIKEENQPCL